MNNAEKFKQIFGLYATELWSMPESDFLAWLNRDVETTQIDHTADIGKKVCVDTISRQAAIEALAKQMPESYTPDGSHPADEEIFKAQKVYADCIETIELLPAVQPVAKDINVLTNDCISRQAAIDYVTYDVEHTIECLKALPSAQPERKKGQWLRYGEDGYPNNEDTVFWQCDQCLEQYTGRAKKIPNFCPNCGADMRGGETT